MSCVTPIELLPCLKAINYLHLKAMDYFRPINRQTLLLWSLLLCLALLGAQEVKLHVHHLDHASNGLYAAQHAHAIDTYAANKVGYHRSSFVHDTSHDHHGDTVSEVDISSDGLLKNINNNIHSIALFFLFFTLITFVSSQLIVQRCRESKLILHQFYTISPPLRAPPQH